MIRLEHLGKRYGRFIALEDFNLEVKAGQSLALLGPNGAGKTTTIRALTGLLRPSSGRAEVNGYDVWAQPTKAKASFGYVPGPIYTANLAASSCSASWPAFTTCPALRLRVALKAC